MSDPLYIEVNPLLDEHLTGIGRATARLVESLSRLTPLRLVRTVSRHEDYFAALVRGQEIVVPRGELPRADGDLDAWVRRLLQRPKQRHDGRLAGQCTGLYSFVRPAERHFWRELGIFYDFTPVILPWTHAERTRHWFGELCLLRAPLYDKTVAISRSTQADAAWLCRLVEENIVVGYPGPSLCVHAHAHPSPVSRRRDVILVVSTLEPRKNAAFVFDWFFGTSVLPDDMQLWWVGPKGWWTSSRWLRQLLHKRRRSRRRVWLLGMVSDQRLCQLYQTSAFTVYASLYEGFGFPVLDSLRHGAPVLCSLNSSLQEFAGPGVFWCDPCDPSTLDAACTELLAAQSPIINRDDLEQRFSWDGLARTVVSLAA